jgi:two-component system nitrate/nitrite response regulator NarP
MRWNDNPGFPPAIRLLVADRQPLVAAGLATLLAAQGHAVAETLSCAAATTARIGAGDIDIAIIDIDLDGAAVAAATSRPVIIVAPSADHPGIAAAIDAGCKGLIVKTDGPASLALCVGAVAVGGQYYDREALALAHDRRHAASGAAQLTPRERDVARLVATGQRNRHIGDTLGISEGTVKMHLHNVYAKLGLESRTQLAMDERLRALG